MATLSSLRLPTQHPLSHPVGSQSAVRTAAIAPRCVLTSAVFPQRQALSTRHVASTFLSSSASLSPSLPSLSAHLSASRGPQLPPRSRVVRVQARGGGGGGGDGSIEASQRILSALVYFLPLLDGARYARFLYSQYPFTRVVLDPLLPLVQAYNSFPYAGLILFFALYLAVIRNPSFNRYVRYNAMQAVILDILMILPSLFERLFAGGNDPIVFQLTVIFYNTVFLYLFSCFGFAVVSCLLGKTPRLPLVAEAADAQVPF